MSAHWRDKNEGRVREAVLVRESAWEKATTAGESR